MKKLILIITIFCLSATPVFALNTATINLELDDSEYWSITDAAQTGLDLTGDLTFQAWARLENPPGAATQTVIGKFGAAGNRSYLYSYIGIDTGTNEGVRFRISNDGSAIEDTIFPYDFPMATWFSTTVTWDASESLVSFYVNGSLASSTNKAFTAIYNGNYNFGIGEVPSSPQANFDGDIDDVRVWNKELSAEEVAANYNCRLQGDETNLQGYWRFDNNGNDETSNSNNLTNNNSATFQSASLPYTADCSGVDGNSEYTQLTRSSSQYWSIADAAQSADLDITGDFTVESWVYMDQTPTTVADRMQIYYRRNTTDGIDFQFNQNGKIQAAYEDTNNVTVSITDDVHEATSTWIHVAVTVDVSEKDFKFYKNGTAVNDTNGTANATAVGALVEPVYIGANRTPTDFVDGRLDDVRVWNDIRTPTEIADNYNCRLDGDETGLVAYWTFDGNGNGQTSNANNLTNNNSATFGSTSLPYTAICSAPGVTAGYFNSCLINL